MKKAAKFLLGAAGVGGLAAGAGVAVTRALKFRPAPELRADPDEVYVDYDRVVESLRAMIRCKTVSSADPANEDAAEFDRFRAYLLERYPTLAEKCAPERIGRCGVLYTWKGRSGERPTVLMAHYDVVPADGEGWDEPPFDAVLKDGIIWGRGALDTKVTLCAIMEAAEQLIKEGFVPANDIYLAFSGEEEPAGPSAGDIVTALLRYDRFCASLFFGCDAYTAAVSFRICGRHCEVRLDSIPSLYAKELSHFCRLLSAPPEEAADFPALAEHVRVADAIRKAYETDTEILLP